MPILELLGKAFLTKNFGIWLARFFSKQSDNLVDDNVVDLIEASLNADPIKMMESAQRVTQRVIEEAAKEINKKDPK